MVMFVVVRHRIVTAFCERLAAQNAPQRQKEGPVRRQCLKTLHGIFRTGRVKAALAAQDCRERVLVETNEKNAKFAQHTRCLSESTRFSRRISAALRRRRRGTSQSCLYCFQK